MKTNKIEIKKAKNKQPFVSVKAKNNKKIATTETYSDISGAKKAAKSLKRIIKDSKIVNKTKKK